MKTPLILAEFLPKIGILAFDMQSIKLIFKSYTLVIDMEKAYQYATEAVKNALGVNNIKVAYSEGGNSVK